MVEEVLTSFRVELEGEDKCMRGWEGTTVKSQHQELSRCPTLCQAPHTLCKGHARRARRESAAQRGSVIALHHTAGKYRSWDSWQMQWLQSLFLTHQCLHPLHS